MDFDLTEEHKMVQQSARDFAQREIAPKAAELDKSARWPTELVKRMAELGFLGMMIPEEYGGGGLDAVSYVLAMEEISAACASCGVIMSVNNSLFCDPVYKFGTPEQKKAILAPTARGEMLGCFGLTEPASGSDAQTMVTSAEKVAGGWSINGAKNWITNGPHADHVLVFAITDKSGPKLKHTAFLVPKGAKGYNQNPPDHKLGIHAAHSCTIMFEDCVVPESAIVGAAGEGFKVAMATLDGGRIGIAAQALGIARAAMDAAISYSKERKSFGVTINNHQAIQFMIADMATELEAARLLTLRAAAMKDEGVRHSTESAIAKLYASEMSTRVAHKALQVFGGYGYSTEYPAERHYRDARITEIYEGTSEIQRLVIAAGVLAG
ncbi:MAG: acyl-CoA dehydrogenase family protein [Polyangiaceae bacterium]|nr:acyl-CoA dehydrogenase family protein [Polyangiaceae bacterium]